MSTSDMSEQNEQQKGTFYSPKHTVLTSTSETL